MSDAATAAATGPDDEASVPEDAPHPENREALADAEATEDTAETVGVDDAAVPAGAAADSPADAAAVSEPEPVASEEDEIAPAAVADTPRGLAAAKPVPRRRATRRRRRWRRILTSMAVTMTVISASAAVSAYVLYQRLDGQITSEPVAEKIGPSRPPVMPEAHGAVNILLMGSDDRTGANKQYGDVGEGTKRSDTTILLHLAADRKSSVAVSIPRDLMVQIPSCVRDDGSTSRAYRDQFNHAFEIGGSACTIKTVELMTQVQIDHHIVIDFTGFKQMVDAVDGVDVCLSEPLHDDDAHLDLDAGQQKLNGEQALAFVRARHDLGDGSDTQRMVRQQRFLASLMHKVQSNGVLFNPVKLIQLLDAGTRSITADPGLDSLDELRKLSASVSDIPSDQSAFLTVPRQPYRYDTNRDELVQPNADALFTAIRYDRVAVAKTAPGTEVEGGGSVAIDQANLPDVSGSSMSPAPGATAAGTAGADRGPATAKPSAGASGHPADDAATVRPNAGASSTNSPEGATGPAASDTAAHASPSAGATAGASGSASASGTSTAPSSGTPSPSATASAPPDLPDGPIVTVTGRTVEQDVCS
ncbi:LCP family protein [Yinghuangia sp. ASG 101]|uniref:LCP family protein n=1 Tax=Yinghuangia sp. ASG 101 TaxID=2896848 RepID=UPI001E493200|nr:LCP family protein [Yinghuangia sp. ASG 101]UGQ09531.1 LCP family protein [Yinghuangia sp. ASG 101]